MGIAASVHNLAALAQDKGGIDEARRLYNESLEINKETRRPERHCHLAAPARNACANQGEIDEARRLYNESLNQ